MTSAAPLHDPSAPPPPAAEDAPKAPSLPLTPPVLLMAVLSLVVAAGALFAAGVLTGVTLSAPGGALASLHGTPPELPKSAAALPPAPAPAPQAIVAAPPEPEPLPPPPPPSLAAFAGADNGSYTLQAGAFDIASRAEDRRHTIESLGLPTRQTEVAMEGGRVLHVVLVGHYPSPNAADQARQALARVGIDAALTTVD